MNHLSRPSLLLAAGLLLAAPLAPAAPAAASRTPATKTTDRFDRTKDHIDALLKQRLNPVPLPAVLPNPFQTPSIVVTGTAPGSDLLPPTPVEPEKPLTDDDDILAHYAGTLKIGGQMMVGGQPHLTINSTTYKEGSLLQVKGPNDTVYYFKILKITPNELTLGYNTAVFTFPLKPPAPPNPTPGAPRG